jgi:hypothetical protein
MDMGNLVTAMMAAGPGLMDIGKIPAELKDLDEAEAQELYTYVKTELELSSPKIEEIVENALEIGLKIYSLISLIRATPAPEAPAAA